MSGENIFWLLFGISLGVTVAAIFDKYSSVGERILAEQARRKSKCPECRYWHRTTNYDLGKGDDGEPMMMGICRRYAPTERKTSNIEQWPLTWHDDSCGEFAGKDQ